jgi:hypothetical protein
MLPADPPTILVDYRPETGVAEWLAFPRHTKTKYARAVFAAIYGHRATATQRRLGHLLVGPILNGKKEVQ